MVALAARLARAGDVPLVIYTAEAGRRQELEIEGVPVQRYTEGEGSVLDQVIPGDLVIVPVHVVHAARRVGLWRISRALAQASLVVMAGPERLTVTGSSPPRVVLGLVGGRAS